jgi:hypothetical protein
MSELPEAKLYVIPEIASRPAAALVDRVLPEPVEPA